MSESTVILPTSYLPPLSYLFRFLGNEKLILDKHEFFIKQSIRNRCYIASANGILPLVIPIMHQSRQNTAMQDVRISNDVNWQKIHWKSIETAYRNSPFFEYYEDHFCSFYFQKFDFLFDFNFKILTTLLKLLKLDKTPDFSTEFIKSTTDVNTLDLRNSRTFHRKDLPQEMRILPYQQVFSDKNTFLPDLSIMDLLSNSGPNTRDYLISINSVLKQN